MRVLFLLVFFLGNIFAVFGQASEKPVLHFLKNNRIKIPVEVPKGEKITFEPLYCAPIPTEVPNEFIICPRLLGTWNIVAKLGDREVWRQIFYVKRTTQTFFQYEKNEVDAPLDLPKNAPISFETDNGSIQLSSSYARCFNAWIIPTKVGKCKVWVKYQGKVVWQEEYEVLPIPSLEIYIGNLQGKPLDLSKPLPMQTQARVCIKMDSVYYSSVIPTAPYRINGFTYTLYRGKQAIAHGRSFDGIPTPQSLGGRSGDKMYIWIEEIVKMTCIREYSKPPVESFSYTIR